MRMDKLHRVFNCDDMAIRLLIAPVHHSGQCGGFARTGSANQNGQATLGHHHVFEYLRYAQAVNRGQRSRDHPHDHADLALLDEGIDPKTTNARR